MYRKYLYVSCVLGASFFLAISGCGSKPKAETVSVIDENHFEQLASTEEEPGNAGSAIETISDGAFANQAAALPPADSALAPIEASQNIDQETTSIAPAPTNSVILKATATYEEKVQAGLKNSGYYDGNVDGKIGPKTRDAIKAFQTANGLKSDGVVGPSTWDALKKYVHTGSN